MGRPREDNIRNKRISEQDYSESDYPGVGGKYMEYIRNFMIFSSYLLVLESIFYMIFSFLYIYLLKHFHENKKEIEGLINTGKH